MHTYLFLRLVEMFNNIVHCISNALLYLRNTYLYKNNQTRKITTTLIIPVSLPSSKE